MTTRNITTSSPRARRARGEERDAIYKQLEQIQVDQNPWLLISHSKLLSAYSPAVQDYYYHVTGNVFLSEMTKLK
jgi:peptide/nickel transport system substrate-binding protein